MKEQFRVLLDRCYPLRSPEAEQMNAMFSSFIENGFSYNVIRNHPDCMVYPSAETLAVIYQQIIEGIMDHHDRENFLGEGCLMAIDPGPSQGLLEEIDIKTGDRIRYTYDPLELDNYILSQDGAGQSVWRDKHDVIWANSDIPHYIDVDLIARCHKFKDHFDPVTTKSIHKFVNYYEQENGNSLPCRIQHIRNFWK